MQTLRNLIAAIGLVAGFCNAWAQSSLQWSESDNGADVSWSEAGSYCASKGNGWRLPTGDELLGLFNSSQSTPCGSANGLQYTCRISSKFHLSGPWLWTNEASGAANAAYVNFDVGGKYAIPSTLRKGDRALCVHG